MPMAKRFFSITFKFLVSVAAVIALITFLARRSIVAFFTADEGVQAMVARCLIMTSCMAFFDAIQGYLQGPIRAMGLQKWASFFAIGCYYILALPLGCSLGFWADFDLLGLQGGFFAAQIVQSIAYFCILMSKDWQDVADEAVKRIKDEEARLAALKVDEAANSLHDGYTKQV